MLPEIGQVALLLALVAALVQVIMPLAGAHRGNEAWMALARPASWLQLGMVAIAYAILTWAFIQSDFSVRYVAENSNTLLPAKIGRASCRERV